MVSKRADRPYRAGRSKGEEPQAPGDEQSERPAGSHSVAMIRRDRFAQPDADAAASHCLALRSPKGRNRDPPIGDFFQKNWKRFWQSGKNWVLWLEGGYARPA